MLPTCEKTVSGLLFQSFVQRVPSLCMISVVQGSPPAGKPVVNVS